MGTKQPGGTPQKGNGASARQGVDSALVARDIPSVQFQIAPYNAGTQFQVMVRRKDLAGVGAPVAICSTPPSSRRRVAFCPR